MTERRTLFSKLKKLKIGCDLRMGIRMGGRKANDLRYADDTTLLAENDKDLKFLLKKVKETSMKAGLASNLNKAKVMGRKTSGNSRLPTRMWK